MKSTITITVPTPAELRGEKLEQAKVFASLRVEKFLELVASYPDNPRCINELLLDLSTEKNDVVKEVLRDNPHRADQELGDLCEKSMAWTFHLKYNMADFGRTSMIQAPIIYK